MNLSSNYLDGRHLKAFAEVEDLECKEMSILTKMEVLTGHQGANI